ncbi:MAG: dicarboxylate/amino acid:cation symporter [Sulfurospirillum sp.]|nr:dicarboxylate/amino acid:cation symporter [Sulfurospirillum sp.]MBL0703684.1 dicarboxylate/amino acid:cation symporter [Sulfurospirillum sp.]
MKFSKLELWHKIFIGLVAGFFTGILLGEKAVYIKPIGDVFINAIRMLIVPLVFTSLVAGMVSLKDSKKMGRISLKTIGFYLFTTMIAITIGLLFGIIMQPGAGVEISSLGEAAIAGTPPELVHIFTSLIPQNPIAALAEGNILQIIAFSIFLGIAINMAGSKGEKIGDMFIDFSNIMFKLTALIMEFAPYGVFALIAWVSGIYGLDVLLPLLKLIVAVYLACITHAIFTYGSILAINKIGVVNFFKEISTAQMIAFTTTSSAGTLPATITCARNLGASKTVSNFVLPLGATINMDGTAIYQGVCVLFIAQLIGFDLSMSHYITIILTSTLASIGTAGVPGAGLIMLTLVLSSVGLPIEYVAIIAGVDRILDMMRTTVNITGDATCALVVSKSENEFNPSVVK